MAAEGFRDVLGANLFPRCCSQPTRLGFSPRPRSLRFRLQPALDWCHSSHLCLLDDKPGAIVERRLEHSLKLGIAQEFVGHIEFSVELPFGAWQWLWQTPFFENVYYAVSSTASGHPLHVPP